MAVTGANMLALLVMALVAAASGAGRARARLRPAGDDDSPLYARADERSAGDRVVLVSADAYDLYRADDRLDDDRYEPRAAPAPAPPPPRARAKEAPKAPPVQTIRNYNKVNDDGSFTFGYEAADGSFKEETRGTDCVVRGKYGYVDPDGNKREFTYVSGNPCDPDRPDEESGAPDSAEIDDNEPANYPSRPPQPPPQPRPTTARPPPPTAYFQNDFRDADEEIEEEPLQHIRQRVVQRPRPRPRPAYQSQQIAITPRPQQVTTARALPPATTFRPQLISIPQTTPQPQYQYGPSPAPSYAQSPAPALLSSARPGAIDFAAEFAKFQRENRVQPTTIAGAETPSGRPPSLSPAPRPASNPIYSTELVYDPSSGQYDTQLFQALPQTKGELNLNQRLQPYVAQQEQARPFVPSQQLSVSEKPAPSPLFRHQIQHLAPQRNPQEAYQRQQAESQYQNSAQLFAQQQQLQHSQLQRDRAAARLQAQRLSLAPAPQRAQLQQHQQQQQQQPQSQFYYVAPRGESQATGQIDSFLRGHGIQF